MIRILLIALVFAVILLAIGIAMGLVLLRQRRTESAQHRPLDPRVIQCFPPGHPQAGEPIPKGEPVPPPTGDPGPSARRPDDPVG